MGTKFDITVHNKRQHELSQFMIEKPKKDLSKVIISPMPGSVISVAVNVGDIVSFNKLIRINLYYSIH